MPNKKLIQKLRSGKKSVLIFICGMPGTRKSSTAVMLGGFLGFSSVIGMDEVRDIMKVYDKNPIVQSKSHYCWQIFGKLNKANFYKGYLIHSRALKKGSMAAIKKNVSVGENTIIEGVHLAPSLYKNVRGARVFHFLLIAKNHVHHESLLRKKFERRHGVQKPWSEAKVAKVELLQDYLVQDARKNSSAIILSETPENNCRKIINWLDKNI